MPSCWLYQSDVCCAVLVFEGRGCVVGVCSLINRKTLPGILLFHTPIATKHSTSVTPSLAALLILHPHHRINYLLLNRAAFMNSKGENALCRLHLAAPYSHSRTRNTICTHYYTSICSKHGLYSVMCVINMNIAIVTCCWLATAYFSSRSRGSAEWRK